ncbi:cytochrome p450 family protein [Phlyctema vagabunda]|uniref:Cytochrome p450 family protein n=1 Tax=Phlyctema vagabunda TaxID=108571 RepID=A0ABR4PW54_9HELO
MAILLTLGLLVLTWLIVSQARAWLRWRSFEKWGRTQGCGVTPTLKNKLPGGIERFAFIFTAKADFDFLEDVIRAPYKSISGYTYRVNSFLGSQINNADPENIQAILATKFQDFDLGEIRRKNFHDVFGDGIFTSEGEAWQHDRAQLKPQFTRAQVSDLDAAERHLQIMFKAFPEEGADGSTEEFDIKPMFYRYTMDASTEFLFGQSVNSQTRALSPDNASKGELEQDIDFAEALNFSQEYVAFRFRLARYYWLANSKKFQRACHNIKEFVGNFVQRALDPDNKRPAPLPGQKEKFVLIDALVAESTDATHVRDQALHLLAAGRDTTASLLSWTILLISRHPDEFKKVREAVLSQFGSEQTPTGEFNFSTLKACKPLTYLLFETLRLYPLLPMNGRRAVRNTTLPTGGGPDGKQPIPIRKGEQVGFSTYVLHRRQDIWGEDADEFRPSRWEGRKLGWEFIPFSGGPRICLGQQYALNEASYVVARFVQRYDKIEGWNINAPINPSLGLTLSPPDVKIRLHKASS